MNKVCAESAGCFFKKKRGLYTNKIDVGYKKKEKYELS